MINNEPTSIPTPLECPEATAAGKKGFTIGLPKSNRPDEKRFPLTPEGVGILHERGFRIKMESGAADSIHYSDANYARHGAEIASRDETLRCDIVIHLSPLKRQEIRRMRKGAMLLTMLMPCLQNREDLRELLDRNIIAVAIDLIEDDKGYTPFADILSEIDGRAAMAVAASMLADPARGKGILLGGIAGVVPCEVTVIGSGISACAAARSAVGAGAVVRMFDNDVYRLRHAMREPGVNVIGSALHPRVLAGALRTADVILFTETELYGPIVTTDNLGDLKKGVLVFDLTHDCGKAFPCLPPVNLADAKKYETDLPVLQPCYVNAGSSVPRTAAMALSNTFITMLHDVTACDGMTNALKLLPGLQKAVYTFLGKAVNKRIAAIAGVRHVDINIFLTLS